MDTLLGIRHGSLELVEFVHIHTSSLVQYKI